MTGAASPGAVAAARTLLEAEGYVVIKATSHRKAQEQRRIDRVTRELAEERIARTEAWAREAFAEERRLATRLGHLYGLAQALGATDEQLRGTAS